MRITFILPTANLSGGARVVSIYADRLSRRGHDVLVVTRPPRVLPLRRRLKSWILNRQSIEGRHNSTSHLDNISAQHKVIDRRRAIVDDDLPDADVVIATWWETAEWVADLSPAKGAKVYFVQHHEIHAGQPVDRVKATYRLPMHKITISKWLVDLLRNEYGNKLVTHVPNSVDMEMFNAPPRGKQEIPTVGLLYSPKEFKGCDVSLKAIEIARKRSPELRLLSFGEHEPPNGLFPAGAKFVRRPPQEEIREIYSKCDVWLCGSYAEGFHLPPLEAMACRCPVVSTKVGGPVDIIEQGVNGYLANVADSEGLADGLLRVVGTSDELWRSMSDAAYETAARYSWDDAAILFEAGLDSVVRGGE